MVDGFSARYGYLLYGSHDCVDRVVLNAYHTLCYQSRWVPDLMAALARR